MWDWLFTFIEPLERAGIPYAIVGSVASAIYGEPRATNDVDILIMVRPEDVDRLVRAFPEEGFYITPAEVIREELQRPSGAHLNVIAQDVMMKADLYPSPHHDEDWLTRRRKSTIAGRTVWVAAPESVILHKLIFLRESGAERHVRDIRGMLRVTDDIDLHWLEERIEGLDLGEHWRRVKGLA
jgi:hypothetical protein